METKSYKAAVELTGEEGAFRSIFATFDIIDRDGDVTVPGAFRDGQQVVIEGWNHDYSRLPVGKGVIGSDSKSAWVDGQFFLDTEGGMEHYRTIKHLAGLEQWSYTFRVEQKDRDVREGRQVRLLKSLDVAGVAPVARGAGIGTRTVMMKTAAGLSDEDVEKLKALLAKADGDEPGDDEGETDDGKPSGRALRDVELELQLLQASTEA